jgi:purine-nucleoside phosphorylase
MTAKNVAEIVRNKAGSEPVNVGLILGSGLASFADGFDGVKVDYADLEGFPHAGVSGHNPALFIGQIGEKRVAVFGGRSHYYEHGRADVMRHPLEVLAKLGADTMIATNAAGSLRDGLNPGDLMMLNDHINFSGLNPLIGEPTDRRFVPMTDAYDAEIRQKLMSAAEIEEVDMQSGVYAWYSGPSFETPAEIRAIQMLGANAVGMSTVPEVILARFLGLRAGAISVITNMGAGMSDESISHEHTKAMAPLGAAKLAKVLTRYLAG